MRILFTSTGSWGTGSFTVINSLAQELIAMGHQVKILFPDNGAPAPEKADFYNNPKLYDIWKFPLKNNKTTITNFPLMIPDPHPRNQSGITFKDLSKEKLDLYIESFRNKIMGTITSFQPDIIECQHIWLMANIISSLKHPYIVTAHHSDQMGYEFDKRIHPFAINAAEKARYIFTISEQVKQEILGLYEVEKHKVITIPNGYNQEIFCRKKTDRKKILKSLNLEIPDNAEIITFTGKISHTKGIETIIEANNKLHNNNIHFLLFGTGDISDFIDNYNVSTSLKRLHFLGHQDPEVLALAHNIAKLSIMPSLSEGFGIAGLEAMGCGLPLIATKNTGAEDFAVGELIEPENANQLAAAIYQILQLSKSEYRKLSKKAEAKAKTFSWKNIAKTRLKYYKKITS